MIRWCRPLRSAMTPPAMVPAALPIMKKVTVAVAATMSSPNSWCSDSGMKPCSAMNEVACRAKNRKHSRIGAEANRRRCPASAAPAAPWCAALAGRGVSRIARLASTRTASPRPTQPLNSSATRQEDESGDAGDQTGAIAQPMVPPTVWMLNARAIRRGATWWPRMA